MRTIKTIWNRSKILTVLIFFQYGLAIFFVWATFDLITPGLRFAVGGLALVIAGAASTEVNHMLVSVKLDKILLNLEQTRQPSTHSPIGEMLAYLTDYVIERSRRS